MTLELVITWRYKPPNCAKNPFLRKGFCYREIIARLSRDYRETIDKL